MRPALCALVMICLARTALAYCFEPSAPSPPWGGPPGEPYCSVNSTSYDRCSDWDIDNYRREVEAYLDDMQRYVDAANRYADEAYDYADCQSQEAVNDWNGFIAR